MFVDPETGWWPGRVGQLPADAPEITFGFLADISGVLGFWNAPRLVGADAAYAWIANNEYGLVQVYGYRSSISIYSSAGSSATGDNLVVVGDQWGLTPAASVGTSKAFGFLCEAITASSSSSFNTTAKAFVRAL